MSEARLRDELCRIGRSLHARGYVHGTTGNLSARLHDGFLITATDACLGDLEPAALSLCPEVAEALEAVRGAGADHALVCGSGPTVAGLWWGGDAAARTAAVVPIVSDRFPGATQVVPMSSPASGTMGDEL